MRYSTLIILLCCACTPPSKSLGGGDGGAEGSDTDASDTNPSASDSDSDSASSTTGDTDGTASGSGEGPGSGGTDTSDAVCDEAFAQAQAFLEENGACQVDADCILEVGDCYFGPESECGAVTFNAAADASAWEMLHQTLTTCEGGPCGSDPCAPAAVCNDQSRCEVILDPLPTECIFEEEVCALLETSQDALDNAMNCGMLALDDPAADWTAARQCALDAQQSGTGFKLIWDVQGIDSFPSQAVVGIQARSYATFELFHDEGGLAGGQFTSTRDCTSIAETPNCEVTPGQMCLTCEGAGQIETTCSAPE